jgi:BASS family bile acid:Na+ symporter
MRFAGIPKLVTINGFIRKHFVHLISLIALLGFLSPNLTQSLRSHKALYGQLDASGFSLFLMMLSAAIQCGFGAFRNVVRRPKPLLVTLGQYFLVLPLSCWILGRLCVPLLGREIGEPIQIGLDLVILMPVAATASIWVRDAKGDIEMLVSLVVITMSLGTLTAPVYLYYMNGLTANSIVIPPVLILRQLMVGVLVPLVVGMTLNKLVRKHLAKIQPYFTIMGNAGLFMAVYLNVGTASPLLRHMPLGKIGWAVAIVLAVNIANFTIGSLLGRAFGLARSQQVTSEFASGMRSNGTALVVGLASFPHAPLVTVPAAIYIIFQHLVAGLVKARQSARYGEADVITATAVKPAANVADAATAQPAARAA